MTPKRPFEINWPLTTPFSGAFSIEKRKRRKLEVSSCFALVLEKTKRKGKAILNTTGLFSPKTMQYFTEYHDFGLRVFIFGIQDYIDSVELWTPRVTPIIVDF